MNRAASIEASLNAIFSAFESGNRDKAVAIAMALWGSNEIRQLRYAADGSEDLPRQMPEAVFPDSSHAMELDEPLDYLACALVGIIGERDPYTFRMAYPSKKPKY